MSVQKDRRREGRLNLSTLARNHAKYVIQITKNPKIFSPEYSHAVTDDIIRQAKDINRFIWAANNVVVNSKEDYANRRQYQKLAVLTCNTLLADVEIAKVIFHLKADRMKYWTDQIIEIRNGTRKWIESDASRYEKYR